VHVRLGIAICYGLAVLLLAAALVLVRAGPVAYLGAGAFGLHLAWQTWRIDRRDPVLALRLFRSNRDAGLILFALLGLDALVRP
jgi:4-hydroxybenzoate polyprenyltransferase